MKNVYKMFPLVGMGFWGLMGCGDFQEEKQSEVQFVSPVATLLHFEFEGMFETSSRTGITDQIEDQLMFTVGQLNGEGGVGRLDAVQLTNIREEKISSSLYRISYHAILPVGWGYTKKIPSQYTLIVPKNASYGAIGNFVSKYNNTCVDGWSSPRYPGPGRGNMWYYYRPYEKTCQLDPQDIVSLKAEVKVSEENTKGSYPEMHKIWEDRLLKAVVIYGKDKAGSTSIGDFGIAQYGQFNYRLKVWGAADLGVKVFPENPQMPAAPGADFPETTWKGEFPDGRKIEIHTFLIDSPRQTTSQFDAKYRELSQNADIIIYNGHAAYGDNVRQFASKGSPRSGQYTIFSMMGCDSYAYIDDQMAKQRRLLNPDDVTGSKYLDMITNIMPTNPTLLNTAATALIGGVTNPEKPVSYYDILRRFERNHFAVVTGDLDNEYKP